VAERQERQDSQLRDAACFLLVAGLCILVVLVSATFPNHERNCKLVQKRAGLERESVELRTANIRLRAEITALQGDPFYIEMVARSKFKLVKEGETLIETRNEE